MTLAALGFKAHDFDVFSVEGFSERMGQIYRRVRPKLVKLGDELAPELSRKLGMEFFPHVARHARPTANPPPETWAAFGPSPKGYQRYGYLALAISSAGLHARAVVKPQAACRLEMARQIESSASALVKAFRGARISRYDRWDFTGIPRAAVADEEFFAALAGALEKKSGGIDVGSDGILRIRCGSIAPSCWTPGASWNRCTACCDRPGDSRPL